MTDDSELQALRELVRNLQEQVQELQKEIEDAKAWRESVIGKRQMQHIIAQDHLEFAD